uniref:Pectinesterase inhibitor domain-containing protein n=1 Tax=Oryza punctata TaxID=4537 RepID=A0A0E0MEI6_ORYPU
MAAAAASPPLLALSVLLLAVVAVDAGRLSAVAGAGVNIGAYVPEASYNPGKLCDNAVAKESCVEMLPRIPGALDAPDYRALAVLLDAYAWNSVQGSKQIADAVRAGEEAGVAVDKCISTCVTGLAAAESCLGELQQLPLEDRLRAIHDGLSELFRDGSDVPAAYSSGCPAGSIHNVDEASIVATFRNVYAVLDLLEQDLLKVYSDGSTPTPAVPAKAAADDNVGAAMPEPAAAAAKEKSTPLPAKESSKDDNYGAATANP